MEHQHSFDPHTFLAHVGAGRTIAACRAQSQIFAQGDAADAVFYIQDGQVKLSVVAARGKEAVIAILEAQAFFGNGCLAGQPLRMATATALTDCSLMRIEKQEMSRVLHAEPVFAELFMAYLLSRTLRIEEDLTVSLHGYVAATQGLRRQEDVMTAEDRSIRFMPERVKSPSLMSGGTFHWDGIGTVSQGVRHTPVLELMTYAARLAPPPAPDSRASPAVPTWPMSLLPLPPPALTIDWTKEAASLSLYLDPGLLLATIYDMIPGATGELLWVPWQHEIESPTPVVHPALLVHTVHESLHVPYVELVLDLPLHDPLLRHIALMLQAEREAESVAGHLYTQSLADALVVHFFRRYGASQSSLPSLHEMTGGLASYKLHRTTAYIKTHLEEKLPLETLAAVAEMSPTHFAHLFKHVTGLAPHQYVNLCRIEHAKRLLAETDLALVEIGDQVGCADQSHFTALFRRHVSMTPKAYRNSSV